LWASSLRILRLLLLPLLLPQQPVPLPLLLQVLLVLLRSLPLLSLPSLVLELAQEACQD